MPHMLPSFLSHGRVPPYSHDHLLLFTVDVLRVRLPGGNAVHMQTRLQAGGHVMPLLQEGVQPGFTHSVLCSSPGQGDMRMQRDVTGFYSSWNVNLHGGRDRSPVPVDLHDVHSFRM